MARERRFEEIQEAIAFAEAGELDTARSIAREVFPEPSEAERILAVGGARGFSRRMVEDSVAVAERLGFGIVALSVAPAMGRIFARFGRTGGRGRRLPLADFRLRAGERGVPFVHAERSGDPERAVMDVSRRFRRIAFLLVDRGLTGKARFSTVDLPIFTLGDS